MPLLGKGAELAMDLASRMARAAEQGYEGGWFRGTTRDIDADATPWQWFSKGPELANQYADANYIHLGGDRYVIPGMVRESGVTLDADKMPKTVTANRFLSDLVEQAAKQGVSPQYSDYRDLLQRVRDGARREESGPHYDRHDFWHRPKEMFGEDGAAALDEFWNKLGIGQIKMTEAGSPTIGVRNPNQVRSVNAAFDPAKKDSSDLLASATPLATAGLLGAAVAPDEAEAALAGISYVPEPEPAPNWLERGAELFGDALDAPVRGWLGLSQIPASIFSGRTLSQSLDDAARMAQMRPENYFYDLGGDVTDRTGSPVLGAAAYALPQILSPI